MTRLTPPRGFALGGALGKALGSLLAGAFALHAAALGAQPPAGDSAGGFGRPGHWALEGAAGGSTSGLGALYFVGRRTALGLDASGAYTYLAPDGADQAASSTARATLAAGVRRYAPVRAGLAAVATAGALLDYVGYDTERTRVGYGPFAEVGLAYRVAPRLAVSGLVRASVARTEQLDAQRGRAGEGTDSLVTAVNARSLGWSSDLARARIALTLLF